MMKQIFLILIVGVVYSCGVKTDNEIKPIKIIQQMQFAEMDTARYYYEGRNITKILHPERVHTLEYRDSFVIKEMVSNVGKDSPYLMVEYIYDGSDKIKEVRYNSLSWADNKLFLAAVYSYEYENGRISREFYYDNEMNHDTLFYNLFEHDSVGNVIKKITFTRDTLNKSYFPDFETIYEYDDKNHYLKNVNYQQLGMYYSKKNNVLKETINFIDDRWLNRPPFETQYKYVYTESNFPQLKIKNESDTVMQITYND